MRGMAFSNIDSKGRKAVKCSHEASSIRKLAVQDTNNSFEYSSFSMIRPRHFERDGYHALYWRDDSDLTDLWGEFPEIVVGHYLVNTSYDSGFLKLSDSERQFGWHMVGRL